MFKLINKIVGDSNEKALNQIRVIVDESNALEPEFEKLTDEQLEGVTADFKARYIEGESLEDILPEAFAAVREASRRTVGMRPFDVQMIGGIVLHQGKIAEMRTGEGKTLVCTMPAYLNAITGKGAHVITVNDYLAKLHAGWMGNIHHALGLTEGCMQNDTSWVSLLYTSPRPRD